MPNPYLPIVRLAGHSAGETKSHQARRESSSRSVREPARGSCLRSDQTNRRKGGSWWVRFKVMRRFANRQRVGQMAAATLIVGVIFAILEAAPEIRVALRVDRPHTC